MTEILAAFSAGTIVLGNGLGAIATVLPAPVAIFALLGAAGAALIARAEVEGLRKSARRVEVIRH
jgi:hypothetical protein